MGRRQVFIRLCGCNLASGEMGTSGCVFCDSPEAKYDKCPIAFVEEAPAGQREEVKNPVDAATVTSWVRRLKTADVHSASLTGGEPLVQATFVRAIAKEIQRLGLSVYLETNGSLPKAAQKVADLVDYACVDIKDESARAAEDWEALVRLEVESASIFREAGCKTFCKIVVTDRTDPSNVSWVAARVSRVGVPLAIQVVTPIGGVAPPSGRQLFSITQAAAKHLQPEMLAVSVQAHRLMNLP